MFSRSEELQKIRYSSYIGDCDSKTFVDIFESRPYGKDSTVLENECDGHVQKIMGVRLRKLKKATKGLSGKGKLTAKFINERSVFMALQCEEINISAITC